MPIDPTAADQPSPAPPPGYSEEKDQVRKRLRRIEGQVRGIERMIEREEYCIDILQQTAALRAAVDSVALLVLEGQVRGIQRMVEDDRYCIDILGQVSAATSALQSVALLLLEEHLAHCVSDAVRAGGDEAEAKLAEATTAIARLVRS